MADAVDTNDDASAVGVGLLGADFTYYLGVCDLFVSVCGDVLV